MSLHTELNEISKDKWRYYKRISFLGYKEAIENPLDFIESYFYYAGKNEFLYESLFNFKQINNEEQNKRAIHTVNTFFLGLYLIHKLDFLKPHKNSFLAKGKNFIWAWFLCSLYHDAFFNVNKEVFPRYNYANFSSGLLYNKSLIKRYFEKEKDINNSHNKQINFDHGIVAAEKLFCNYTKMIDKALIQNDKDFKDLLSGEVLEYCGLKISNSTFHTMCKIVKIISCHNIYISKKQSLKYNNLPELVKENKKFRYMPNTKNRQEISSYEKLYFLLALVDTLEPSKRGIDLKEIDIQVDKTLCGVYDLHINLLSTKGEQGKYLNAISQLKDWLNFVKISDDAKTIHIDFSDDKNHLQIFG